MSGEFLRFGPRIWCLPVVHGSGDCAVEVRRVLLSESWDCVAVPLPPSFRADVESAIERLPVVSIVLQRETTSTPPGDWTPEADAEEQDEDPAINYVPIDPCQPVIAALRIALQERLPRAYVDRESAVFEPMSDVFPDPYALKRVPLERFVAAITPHLPPPRTEGQRERIRAMGQRLKRLEGHHRKILFVCGLSEWLWVRDAYRDAKEGEEVLDDLVEDTECYPNAPQTHAFLLGELPFVTGLYERARATLDEDENLSIDGVKQLLLETRTRYEKELGRRAQRITPQMLKLYLKYVRNLSLLERRLTPDLYTLVVAAQQIMGDEFAARLAETSKTYPYGPPRRAPQFRSGVGRGALPDGTVVRMKSRLPGHPVQWRRLQLKKNPSRQQQRKWQFFWNPFEHCSWPPEDIAIERFRSHVKDVALAMLGNDLARTEKFTTSIKDGLDIRETIRNWHTGDLYVKVLPPARGTLDCVLMFFDSPADPRDYPWRTTWMAEEHDESTLALFATDFTKELVGPGIGLAVYGGAMFLFPPRPIPDIWRDRRFDFADTLEERLLAAACHYARARHIAVLSEPPPGAGWRRLARHYGKKLIHVPLSRFSRQTVQQLRYLHVLNGKHVRSYAADFIRRA